MLNLPASTNSLIQGVPEVMQHPGFHENTSILLIIIIKVAQIVHLLH